MLHDNLLVKRIPEPDGLIIAPDIAKRKAAKAKVLSVGPGRWVDGVFTKTAVKPGDVVVLPGIAAQVPDWETKDICIVNSRDVAGILIEDARVEGSKPNYPNG